MSAIAKPQQTPRSDGITALYMGWTYPQPKPGEPAWLPVYRMSWDDDGYFYYSYTQALKIYPERARGIIINPDCGYAGLWKTKYLDGIYSNRIPRRGDLMELYDLVGIGEKKDDWIAYLACSGGKKSGDNFDIFPELTLDENGWYHFHFPLYGLTTEIRNGNNLVREIADTIELSELLTLKINSENARIFCRNIEIGYCPSYVYYFLTSLADCKYTLELARVNRDDRRYAMRIMMKLSLQASSSIFEMSELKPINPMPV
jgi:hypothetical protein